MRAARIVGMVLLVVSGMALGLPAADAGKGGNKGGGGGGGGGGSVATPLYELVTQVQVAHSPSWGTINAADLAGVNLDGSAFVQMTDDEPVVETGPLAFDGRGEVLLFGNYGPSEVLEPETGDRTVLSFEAHTPSWTRRLDANSEELAPWYDQFLVVLEKSSKGDANPLGNVPTISDVVIKSVDGTTTWPLTDCTGTWDSGTSTYTWTNARNVMYVPEQHGVSGLSGRAWVFYLKVTEDWYYDASTGSYTLVPSSVLTEWHRLTLDTTNWDSTGPDVVRDDIVASTANYGQIAPNGLHAAINQDGVAYVVDVDFTTDANGPVIPTPSSSDRVAVTIPQYWEPEVEVRAVSDDGSKVALNLWRVERIGKGKSAFDYRRRHLFVSDRDGSGLVQVDADPVDFDLTVYGPGYDIAFKTAAFRPVAN